MRLDQKKKKIGLHSSTLVYEKNKKTRRNWVREIFHKRDENGTVNTLVQEMKLGYNEYYFR